MKKFLNSNKITAWAIKNKIQLALFLIILLGAYLRLNNFSDLARFNDDQVRDAKIVDSIFETGEFPLLGPKAGGTSFNLGPAFYYLQYLSAFIFGQNPQGMAFFIPILSVVSIGLFFLFFKNIFSKQMTLALALLYATSFFTIKYSRFAWNPNAIPFFLFAFLNLYLAILSGKRSIYYHLALAATIGISIQLHTILLVLLPLFYAGLYIHLYLKNQKIPLREICFTLLIILFFNIPFFISDIKNGGENIGNFFSGTQTKSQQSISFISNLKNSLSFMAQGTTYALSGFEPQKNWAKPIKLIQSKNLSEIFSGFLSFSFLIAGLYFLTRKIKDLKNSNQKNALLLLSLVTLASFLLFLIIGEELNLRFFIVVVYFPFLLAGLLFESLAIFSKKYYRHISLLGLFFVLLFASFNLVKYSKVYDLENYQEAASAYGGISIGEARMLSDFMKKNIEDNKDFTPFVIPFEFKRSVEYFNSKNNLIVKSLPKNDSNNHSIVFLITKKEAGKNLSDEIMDKFDVFEQTVFGRFSIVLLRPKITYKIGFITDIHGKLQKNLGYRLNFNTASTLDFFVSKMNKIFKPNLVIQNGDYIDGTARFGQKSFDDFAALQDIFAKLDAPHYNVLGNHDLRGLTAEQWKDLSGYQNTFFNVDQEKLRIIVLDGNDGKEDDFAYYPSQNQFDWLEKTLSEAALYKKIVFIHYPIVSKHIAPGDKMISPTSAAELKRLFSDHGVIAVFSGHIEKLELNEEGGVKYFVIPGLFRSENKTVTWYDSFAELTIRDNISVDFYYKKDRNEKTYQSLKIPSKEFEEIIK